MKRRQTSVPRQWLVADTRLGGELWAALALLPRGSGVLLLYRGVPERERQRLVARVRLIARRRRLAIADEAQGDAARIHDLEELRRTLVGDVPLLFLSPMFPTRSHPEWEPLSHLRAAVLARLSPRPVIALGGMNARRYEQVKRLGFAGWAGIDGWRSKSR